MQRWWVVEIDSNPRFVPNPEYTRKQRQNRPSHDDELVSRPCGLRLWSQSSCMTEVTATWSCHPRQPSVDRLDWNEIQPSVVDKLHHNDVVTGQLDKYSIPLSPDSQASTLLFGILSGMVVNRRNSSGSSTKLTPALFVVTNTTRIQSSVEKITWNSTKPVRNWMVMTGRW